jgi:hypothetical protein
MITAEEGNDLVSQMAEIEVKYCECSKESNFCVGWITCFIGKGQRRFTNDQSNIY